MTENNQKFIVFNCVTQNFNETEPLKMLEKKDVEQLLVVKEDTEYTMADFIIYYHSKYNLNKFLGDIILGAYKKEDPEEQQIWLKLL